MTLNHDLNYHADEHNKKTF